MQYTREQILQLAPDDASAKAGQQLATRSKWVVLSENPKALWGDCQGSGKTPYKTIVDLTNIAFKCTCPSRKFPCKHGLGLLLLYAADHDAFSQENELPEHVAEWIGKREVREVAKEQNPEKQPDDNAKAKRIEARERKVQGGIEELRAWLRDIIRTGLMHIPQQAYQFNSNITARMVDAQAGGLAAQLRQINQLNFFADGWQKPLLKRLSGLYMLTEGYLRLEQLPSQLSQELRTLIGWTFSREEVLQGAAITDHWLAVSVSRSEESNLTTERIWLYGFRTGRYALLLNFYAGNQPYQTLIFPGMQMEADVVYYPASVPTRALIREQRPVSEPAPKINIFHLFSDIYNKITEVLSQSPFTELIPFLIEGIRVTFTDNTWFATDGDGLGVPLSNTEDECWQMLAFTGGRLFSAFGVYDQGRFDLHYIWTAHQAIFLKS